MKTNLNIAKITFIAILVIVIIFGGWLIFKDNSQESEVIFSATQKESIEKEKEIIQELSRSKEITDADFKDWNKYQNSKSNFSLNYPKEWFYTEEETADNSFGIKQSIIFSNYQKIDDFRPENKPEDFHLLGLIIYNKTENQTIEKLAESLGFDQKMEPIISEFKTADEKLTGKKYITMGEEEGSPRTAIFFEKENSFLVFNFGFIGGDKQTAQIMEKITSSLNFSNNPESIF